jgi:hypothetical protein
LVLAAERHHDAFTTYLSVGNDVDRDLSILKIDGTTVTDTGKRLDLCGQPASMRGSVR